MLLAETVLDGTVHHWNTITEMHTECSLVFNHLMSTSSFHHPLTLSSTDTKNCANNLVVHTSSVLK